MAAYYNEIDPKAAAWLRQLILKRMIAPGEVDERSITEVHPDDIKGFTQCHFFAGIGVWSYALRRAGWPDDRPVWTGSCPCQPFSSAGKKGGFDDERHLWPEYYRLIRECQPAVALGEQVASKDGLAWVDAVQTDLETSGYAFGAADLCAAGVGAPHIRQRLWFVAERLGDTDKIRRPARGVDGTSGETIFTPQGEAPRAGSALLSGGLADADRRRQQKRGECDGDPEESEQQTPFGHDYGGRNSSSGLGNAGRESGERGTRAIPAAQAQRDSKGRSDGRHDNGHTDASEAGGLADAEHNDRRADQQGRQAQERTADGGNSQEHAPGPVNGFWRSADWLGCRDGKFRPVEPGTFPLVDGAPARVGRLRGYGNAINAEVARIFIESYLEGA